MRLPGLNIGSNTIGHAYKNERIIMIVHHHWWNLLKEVLGVSILLVLPLLVVPIIVSFAGPSAGTTGPIVVFLGALWALMCWHFLFIRWTDFYFDIWIITNWRIIDMDLKGLFWVEIGSLLDLDHIQEITSTTKGIIHNILGIGTIFVQTAATMHSEFRFFEVSNPQGIENLIRKTQLELHVTKSENQQSHDRHI